MKRKPLEGYEIEEFKPEYKDQVIALISQVLRDEEAIPDYIELIDDEDLHRIPEIYSGRSRFWIAVKDDKVIGTVAIKELSGNTAKLRRMFVFTKYHGSGLGQALLDQALNFARRKVFKGVILNTHPLMKRAHHFYEKNGFQKTGEDLNRVHYKLDL